MTFNRQLVLKNMEERTNKIDGQTDTDLTGQSSHLQHIGVENDASERTKIAGAIGAI